MSNHFHGVIRTGIGHCSRISCIASCPITHIDFNRRHDGSGPRVPGPRSTRARRPTTPICDGPSATCTATRSRRAWSRTSDALADYRWCGHGALARAAAAAAVRGSAAPPSWSCSAVETSARYVDRRSSPPDRRAPLDAFEALLEEVCRESRRGPLEICWPDAQNGRLHALEPCGLQCVRSTSSGFARSRSLAASGSARAAVTQTLAR